MTKLTDTQSILLSAASQRENGSLYPLPSTLRPERRHRQVDRCTLVSASDFAAGARDQRCQAAVAPHGRATCALVCPSRPAGLQAIGIEDERQDAAEPQPHGSGVDVRRPRRRSRMRPAAKSAAVLALLQRAGPAQRSPELIEATGWLPHTTRAALTGLKQEGPRCRAQFKRADVTCYRVVTA